MDSISVVVTAPDGIAACVYMEYLAKDADGKSLEIVDGALDFADWRCAAVEAWGKRIMFDAEEHAIGSGPPA